MLSYQHRRILYIQFKFARIYLSSLLVYSNVGCYTFISVNSGETGLCKMTGILEIEKSFIFVDIQPQMEPFLSSDMEECIKG